MDNTQNLESLFQKAYIKTYGCQMNEQDSSQMQVLLGQMGFGKAFDPYEADLLLINTCSIREKAAHKIYSELGRIRHIKEDRPHMIVGIAGCVAEQEKKNLSSRFPFLDLVFGPDHIRHLPEMVEGVLKKRNVKSEEKHKTEIRTGFNLRKDFKFVNVLPDDEEHPVKAFVNIQKGCDNICSFCIVPFVRGREVSRPHEDIISEIQQLVEKGVKEVTLLGQNVNSYGLKNTGGITFANLLEEIANKTDLKRLRFTTSHPKDVKEDLIIQYRDNPILVPHFHLPVQAGNTRVLDVMKRQYSREEYLDIVQQLKETVPEIRFSTDIIVGFPSETEAEFEETLTLCEEVRYDSSFSFVYSPRPYTKAIKLQDDVPYKDKLVRLKRLQDLCNEIGKEQHEKDIGTMQEVLIEMKDEEMPHKFKGRTATNKIVHFNSGDYQAGDIVQLKITQAGSHCLFAE